MGRWSQAKRRGTSVGGVGGDYTLFDCALAVQGLILRGAWDVADDPTSFILRLYDVTAGQQVETGSAPGGARAWVSTAQWVGGHQYRLQITAVVGTVKVSTCFALVIA